MLLLASCAQTVPIVPTQTEPAGFWLGIWHGFILIFGFIGSLFDSDIAMYATNNAGGWYDFGYILGISLWLSLNNVFDD
jgi:hypothetical protein